jgi:electron transfer flavoprotein alpha subunit
MSSVYVCTWSAAEGGLPDVDKEALTLGRKIAADMDASLKLVAVGGASESAIAEAGRFGAVAVDSVEDARLGGAEELSPDVYVEAIGQWFSAVSPRLVLMNQSFDARLIAPRLARRVRAGIVMNGIDLEASSELIPDVEHEHEEDHIRVTTSAFGGDTRQVYALTGADAFIVCLSDNSCEPSDAEAPVAPEVNTATVDLAGIEERIRVLQKPDAATGPKLEDAQVIVAGGRGLGGAANFRLVEELAAAMGGVAGASRPIVDDGWTDSSHQVGLTGKITKPTLYIAAGISGASQHMVGCCASKTIVAINTDPDAAIFKHARYGIVGNCVEVLAELIKAVKG